MGKLEIRDLIVPGVVDADYIREVAETKRALELWTMEPGFQEKFMESPEDALAAHGLHIDVPSVRILVSHEEAEKYRGVPPEELPPMAGRYRGFIYEKLRQREHMVHCDCVPAHAGFRAWRTRQVSRCWAELGRKNGAMVHAPLMFELALGCSVGCPFCGIAAGKLQKVCRYDEENRALWRGILSYMKDILGPAAGSGTCYYATEPLDNPDYEKFVRDYFEILGMVPQITTAASMRNPARTKALLEELHRMRPAIHRFSVLSLDILHQLHGYFRPEELLYVELLPQFIEAPSCHFSKAGRAQEMQDDHVVDDDANTISCISGFVVNMAERSVRLLTPCPVSEAHPTGEYLVARESFSDLEDFKRVLEQLMGQFMAVEMPKDQPLRLRPSIEYEMTGEGITFSRKKRYRLRFGGSDDISPEVYQKVLTAMQKGGSPRGIAALLLDENIAPAYTFFILKKFETAGLFLEGYE